MKRLGPELVHDTHEAHRALRADGGVHEVVLPNGLRSWIVTGYELARAVLADGRLSKDRDRTIELVQRHQTDGESTAQARTPLSAHMLNADPPDHTRLRKLVGKEFTTRRMEGLRERVREITGELLDDMDRHDEVDLLPAFAFPLPITVICELLGVPLSDRETFREWSTTLVSSVPPAQVQEAAVAMAGYFTELIAHKRANPDDALLSGLVRVSEDGDRLSEGELVSMMFLLLVAGHETTVNLIGNGVLALLRHPDQFAALRADPSLLPGAVEELLRYDSPVNLTTLRYTTEPITLEGQRIPADDLVVVALTSANRDADRFAEADRLDVTRAAAGHLAFGHGIHHCVGAPLARMEGEIAIGALLERFPKITLAAEPDELRRRASSLMHGLEALPVRLR
ncbi:cytochrome P450 [Herbihabitans rhizosphaerae]|uniref:Cytochrome P450 n=1 Tax=Herbihabitans rhizosphaerae TaxID=1872711 RepID=A0A4Q7KHT2_9PSEU|nr:cytochrome P450 [Herbihabitans rhizosphaerae]RZS34853.1 cytochrome P450 [Herbihabitans rhizosphaerae]